MCRFLLLSSDEPCEVREVMEQFARMCEQSTCLDGDWQGDGWGVAWWEEHTGWSRHRSLAPVWTEADYGRQVPATRRLVVHARAASFPEHKGDLAFAQPLRARAVCLRVQRPHRRRAPAARHEDPRRHRGGENLVSWYGNGWTKAWSLRDALAWVYAFLERHSRRIQGCNMGLSDGRQRGEPQRQSDRPAVLPASSGTARRCAPDLLRTLRRLAVAGLAPEFRQTLGTAAVPFVEPVAQRVVLVVVLVVVLGGIKR